MPHVVIYSRKGCHLCDVAKEEIERLRGSAEFQLEVIDIDSNEELRQKYNDEVPVIFINGKKAFKYRVDPTQFLRKLVLL